MFVDFTFNLFNKGNLTLSILVGLVLTKAVDVEGMEIDDDETAQEAHVVAAETDRVALLHAEQFYLICELTGILLKAKQLEGRKFSSLSLYCGIPVVCQ